MKAYNNDQLQLFQYEETLQNLKYQLHLYEAELASSWQSQEMIPLRESIHQLQEQLQLCSRICEEIAGSEYLVY